MAGRISRILVESTCSLDTHFTTGIQRVVRSVIGEMEAASKRSGVECVPVVFRKDRFYDARNAWARRLRKQNQNASTLFRRLRREVQSISPHVTGNLSYARKRLQKAVYPKTLVRAATNACWKLRANPVSFRETDVLLLLDETWRLPIWPTVERARAAGCRVGAVVYDLIPVDHPQCFETKFADLFAEQSATLLQNSDFLLPISQTVAGRLKVHLSNVFPEGTDLQQRVAHFRLGAATSQVSGGGSLAPHLARLFNEEAKDVPYLCVGTIEPRKNHRYLLDAFEIVWSHFPQVKLCIAGRIGWKSQDIVARIRSHPRFGKSLFHFPDLEDSELFNCYRRARALVSCSLDEGFGLPIVEGLRHGIQVMASDIPVHREIGRQSCDYFDLADPRSLAETVIGRESGRSPSHRRTPETLTTWKESCEDLLVKTLALAQKIPTGRPRGLSAMNTVGRENCAGAA